MQSPIGCAPKPPHRLDVPEDLKSSEHSTEFGIRLRNASKRTCWQSNALWAMPHSNISAMNVSSILSKHQWCQSFAGISRGHPAMPAHGDGYIEHFANENALVVVYSVSGVSTDTQCAAHSSSFTSCS